MNDRKSKAKNAEPLDKAQLDKACAAGNDAPIAASRFGISMDGVNVSDEEETAEIAANITRSD